MTLSRFLRDYVYVPLGGNRVRPLRQAANVVMTMLLGGLWHGAAWSFVVWGGLHGLALALNGAWNRQRLPMPRLLGWALTLLFVIAAWVLFRADSFAEAWSVIRSMLGLHGLGRYHLDNLGVVGIACASVLLAPSSQNIALHQLRPSRLLAVLGGSTCAFLLLLIGGRLPNAFIYFRF